MRLKRVWGLGVVVGCLAQQGTTQESLNSTVHVAAAKTRRPRLANMVRELRGIGATPHRIVVRVLIDKSLASRSPSPADAGHPNTGS